MPFKEAAEEGAKVLAKGHGSMEGMIGVNLHLTTDPVSPLRARGALFVHPSWKCAHAAPATARSEALSDCLSLVCAVPRSRFCTRQC